MKNKRKYTKNISFHKGSSFMQVLRKTEISF